MKTAFYANRIVRYNMFNEEEKEILLMALLWVLDKTNPITEKGWHETQVLKDIVRKLEQ